jgi:ATP-dependent DNA helicase DinG
MDAVFDQCSEQLEEMGFNLLRQGDYPREETLRRFREGKASVLFAVSSFWEGVDIQGDDLKLVILVKLPFAVPTEPILQARMEDLERQGKNPFYHFTVPMASLRLKQGFGRLIRSKSDRGVIAILDKRIKTKSYGRRFFKDLPVTPVIHELSEVEAFYSLEENQ